MRAKSYELTALSSKHYPVLSLDSARPVAEEEADPGADDGAERCPGHADGEPQSGFGFDELAEAVPHVGAGVVVEVDGAEEAVFAGFRHEEGGEGPLDREEE